MAQFLCSCGHIIRDQSDHLPYKGEIIRDQSEPEFYEGISHTISEFIQAISQGKRNRWIDHFYGTGGPKSKDLDDSEVIYDILTWTAMKHCLPIFQCDKCFRIYISRKPHTEPWDFAEFNGVDVSEIILKKG